MRDRGHRDRERKSGRERDRLKLQDQGRCEGGRREEGEGRRHGCSGEVNGEIQGGEEKRRSLSQGRAAY